MMMSNLNSQEVAFLETLLSDEAVYPWNPLDKESEASLSEQEEKFDFTEHLSDEDIKERTASLFTKF